MNNLKTIRNIGIVLAVIGISLIFINDIFESDFLKTLAEYKDIFVIFGGAFIGAGLFGKQKNKKTS